MNNIKNKNKLKVKVLLATVYSKVSLCSDDRVRVNIRHNASEEIKRFLYLQR